MKSHNNISFRTGVAKPVPLSALEGAFRVLIIDDDEAECELTIRNLGQAWPFEREMIPEWADSGPEALEKMRTARYALVVLDWKLPGMNGDEVLHAMRQKNIRTPVIVISGLERSQIADDLESLGAAFLNKDELNTTTLHDMIAESLRLLGLSPAGVPH